MYVHVCATHMLCGCVLIHVTSVIRMCIRGSYIGVHMHICPCMHIRMCVRAYENRPLKRVRAEWGVFLRAPRTCIYVYVPRDTDLCERIFLSPLFCWPSWPSAIRRLSLPSSRHRCLGCCAAVAPRPRHLLGKAALRMVGGGRRARRVRKAEGCI